MPDLSWGEIVLIALLVLALFGTGRLAAFARGVRRGVREDDPGFRVRFVDPDTSDPTQRNASQTPKREG